jgi:photosystem II stability/assembly factor-like uncharacterized protein
VAAALALLLSVLGVAIVQAGPAAAAHRGVHFRTPEGAMRYLARAYNRNDISALKMVTTPRARDELLLMRTFATHLRLRSCVTDHYGHTRCNFAHGFANAPRRAYGHADFAVAPADKPGWYMTVLESCG